MSVVTTQDVSFGACWVRLLGKNANWEPRSERPPGDSDVGHPFIGPSVVAVWVTDEGPVLVCRAQEGMRAIKDLPLGSTAEQLRDALRESGAVLREHDAAEDL